MAPHEFNNSRSLKGTMLSVVAIMIGIVLCTSSLVVVIDLTCRSDINHWMPIYPGAEVQTVTQGGFFRVRASGVSEVIYVTDDDVLIVQEWYREYRREITRDRYNSADPESAARGMATTSYRIVPDKEGDGTRIVQYSECAYT